MATYSSAPVESIIKFSYKDTAFNSTAFTKTLATVNANEQYELMQLHAVAQDGDVAVFQLYGDYDSLVDNPGNSGQGLSGYSWIANFAPFTNTDDLTSFNDGEQIEALVDLSTLDYSISSNNQTPDQLRGFVNNFGPRRLAWREGAVIKLRYILSNFTPANEEFFDVDIWLKKTVFNG